MTNLSSDTCPHCGQPIQRKDSETAKATAENRTIGKEEAPEHDHRGVLMPRRSRMGGIITPQ